MYSPIRSLVAAIFLVSPDPPRVPPGSHGEAHVFRASRAYWKYRMLGLAVGMSFLGLLLLGGAVGALVALYETDHTIIGLVVAGILAAIFLGLLALQYALVRLDYEFRWYVVTDRSLRIRQGIRKFEETTLTFANVQNVSIQQGPIERWFGFANVLVETAGGGGGAPSAEAAIAQGGHRGLIRGLDDAARVRDLIREAVVRQGGAGLGDARDEPPPEPANAAAIALAAAAPGLQEVLDEVRGLREALERPRG